MVKNKKELEEKIDIDDTIKTVEELKADWELKRNYNLYDEGLGKVVNTY